MSWAFVIFAVWLVFVILSLLFFAGAKRKAMRQLERDHGYPKRGRPVNGGRA